MPTRPWSVRARVLASALVVGAGVAWADEDPYGLWAPMDGHALTSATAAKIPEDGAACIDQAVSAARFDIGVIADSLTGGEGMQLSRYKEAFAKCMVKRGWRRVDDVEFAGLRTQGQLLDCLAGMKPLCAGAVSQFVHGVPGVELDAKYGMETGRRLCEAGDSAVCMTMASLYLRPPEGRGLEAAPKLAVKMAARGCDAGAAEACGFAGVLLSTDAAGEPDIAKGRRYLDVACAKGERSACTWPLEPPAEVVLTELPDGARWCRYGGAVIRGTPDCASAPVTWLARATDRACEPKLSVDLGNCHYEYRLGN